MTEEKTFFQYADVTVTNFRFIVGGETYAMSNITSVKASQHIASRSAAILLIILGAILLYIASQHWIFTAGYIFGGILVVVGIVSLVKDRTMYHVSLTTASGETNALRSEDREYIEKVVKALNDAIVARG